jgi:glycosyltransferase involved in cell wall biosynthesis
MRILIVNRAMGTLFGGGETFDSNAARHLTNAGHSVKILAGKPLFGRPRNVFPDLDVDYLGVPNIRRVAYSTEKINNKLSAAFYYMDLAIFEHRALGWLATAGRHSEYDVIQVCGLFGLAERILTRWGIPTIGWLPGIPSKRVRKKIKRLVRVPGFRLFSRGDPVRFIEETMSLDVATIEPGLDLEAVALAAAGSQPVRARLNIPEDALLGVTVARLVPVKNIEFLLDGLLRAIDRVSGLHHVIVGDGPLRSALERRVRSLDLQQIIHFVGHQNPNSLHLMLAASDFFVLPSRYENFSNAVLEAMAHGLPVIGTQVGYLQDLIRDSGAGVTVPLGDVDSLSNAICDMAAHAGRRKEYSERGREFAKQFAWPTMAEKLVSLYRDAQGVNRVG